MKRIVSILLVMAMLIAAFALTGCKLNAEAPAAEEPATGTDAAQYDVDSDAAVATIGDEKVTWSAYKAMFDMYSSYYTSMGYNVTETEEGLAEFQDFVINALTQEKVTLYQAKKLGLDQLTEEQQAELQKTIDENIAGLDEYYRQMAEEEAAIDDTIDVEQYIRDSVAEEAKYYTGLEMTYEQYMEYLTESYKNSYYIEQLRENIGKDITVSADDVQGYYDEHLEAAKTAYESNPGTYKDEQEYVEMYGGEPVLSVPEGFSRIYHILITPEGEINADYETKLTEMDSLKTQYGALAFEQAESGADNAEKMKTLLAEYAVLKTETDAMLEEHLSGAKAKTEELYAQLSGGADFKTLMLENTKDVNITNYSTVAEKGLLISGEYQSSTDWSDAVKAEFAKLTPGQYSGVFTDDEGCHIIYYIGDEKAGVRSVDDVYADIEAILLEDLRTAEWDAKVQEWMSDGSVVIDEALVALLKG